MADIFCPECGSIDHIAAAEVRFPYQCPGCDAIIQGPSLDSKETGAAEPLEAGTPVRMQLLRTVQWNQRKKVSKSWRDARSWVYIGAFAALLAGFLIVWSILQPQEETYPSARAQDPDTAAPARRSAVIAANPKPAQPEEKFASPEQAADAGKGLAEVGSAEDALRAAMAKYSSDPETQPASATDRPRATRQLIPTSIRTAVPLYPGVPILERPSWNGRQLTVLTQSERLLIVERNPHSAWLHVVAVLSGTEGWVQQNQVRINGVGE